MPRGDLITINGESHYGLNVFDTMGIGGANNPGDVMTVQAMFRFLHDNGVRQQYPNALFTRDKPGEYTVKIFLCGTQVREAKFTIDQRGWIAPNAFSNQIFLTNYKIAVPVKVMGTLDKWNPVAGKADQFYGNPLTDVAIP